MAVALQPIPIGHAEMLVPGAGDHLSNNYLERHTWYEDDLLRQIAERQQGGTFVDVGAHYGNHTVFFATECRADRVIAVEPHPVTFEILAANIAHNHLEAVVEARRLLIHASWKSCEVVYPTEAQLEELWCASMLPILKKGGPVHCMTLNTLLADEQVDVIKIDVEDMGSAVLRSGRKMLKRCRPLVAIEADGPPETEIIDEFLSGLGYTYEGTYCATPTHLWEP